MSLPTPIKHYFRGDAGTSGYAVIDGTIWNLDTHEPVPPTRDFISGVNPRFHDSKRLNLADEMAWLQLAVQGLTLLQAEWGDQIDLSEYPLEVSCSWDQELLHWLRQNGHDKAYLDYHEYQEDGHAVSIPFIKGLNIIRPEIAQ